MINKFDIYENITLREYLKKCNLSNSYIYKLNMLKAISGENSYISLDTMLNSGESIYINFSLLETNNCQVSYGKTDLKILYEDDNIIASYKKRGILVHSDGNFTNTLLDEVVNYLAKKGDDSVVRALHRLDVDTCGVVLFSKNLLSYTYISKQMEENKIDKEYLALVEGDLTSGGVIDIGIGRDRHNSKKSVATKKGKASYTEYMVLKKEKNKTLLKVKIKTGRTHQIRVHMAYINHPIVGDKLYGKGCGELQLLCKQMSFNLFGRKITIKCEENL